MAKHVGYLAIGHKGTTVHLTDPDRPPRGQLLAKLDRTSARNIYRDGPDGQAQHVGYIAGGEWFEVFEVCPWAGKAS